jgi:hypothetical protein
LSDFEFTIPEANVRQPMPRVRFFIDKEPHPGESAKQGRPIFFDVEKVSIINPGSRDDHHAIVDDSIRQRFPAQYKEWKETRKELVKGEGFTPLVEAPFLGASQIEELRHLNIVTVEMLANLNDAGIQRIGMGARDLVAKAKGFLRVANDTAAAVKLQAELAERDQQIAALNKTILDIGARFDAMQQREKQNA